MRDIKLLKLLNSAESRLHSAALQNPLAVNMPIVIQVAYTKLQTEPIPEDKKMSCPSNFEFSVISVE
jgi:hypothetical protein